MASFETELEAFDTAINDYKNAIVEITEMKTALLKAVDTLKSKNGGWESDAGEAFFSKFDTDWVENVDLYVKIIELMNSILYEARDSFSELVTKAQSLHYNS